MFVKNDNSWVFWPGLTDQHLHNHAKWEEFENSYSWNFLLVFERPDRCILEKWNCRSSFWLDWKLPLSKLFFGHHEVYKKEQGHNNFSFLKLSLVFFLLFDFSINMKMKFRKQKTCFLGFFRNLSELFVFRFLERLKNPKRDSKFAFLFCFVSVLNCFCNESRQKAEENHCSSFVPFCSKNVALFEHSNRFRKNPQIFFFLVDSVCMSEQTRKRSAQPISFPNCFVFPDFLPT